MNRMLRALGASVLLVALVVGVPVALTMTAGWPLPSKVPDIGNIATMVRQNNIQADFVIKSIALVVWLAWIQLMIAVVWEVAVNVPRLLHGRRQRPAPLVVAPVANGVATLFSVILTAGLLSTLVSQPAIALTSTSVDLSPHTSSLSLRSDRAATPDRVAADSIDEVQIASVWVAERDDSLWDIAEQALGDGSEVSLIMQMNPDLTASQTLAQGTEIRLPSGARIPASRTRVTTDRSSSKDAAAAEVPTSPATRQYTVQANDGMWNAADALLGDGSRHAELHSMLVGQEVAPGVVFTADTYVIHEGWVFTIADPSGTTDNDAASTTLDTHTVVVGDTLSAIAEEQLGDADAWPEIFEENVGRQMGDGRTFDDPNLILPGWEIDLPADDQPEPAVSESRTPGRADDVAATDDRTTTLPDAPTEAPAPTVDDEPDRPTAAAEVDDSDGVPTPTPAAAPAPATTPSVGTTSTTLPDLVQRGGSGGDIDDGRPDNSPAPAPVRLEHAALLAAGILALVAVRRRQRLRAATPRTRVPEPPPSVVATERRLRTVDAGERALRVDIAIRAAAHGLVDTDAQIGLVLVDHDGGVELRLTAPADLGSPWESTSGDHQWWALPAAIPIELLSEPARRVGTPCVALVQLGLSDQRDVLIDVEACGTLAVDAPSLQATEVVTALATGLATSPYAEIAHLITVAVPEACVVGHRNAHRAATPVHALELATSLIGSTSTSTRSTFALRSLRTGGEMWEPAVILLDATDGSPADLPAELPMPGRGVGLVSTTQRGGLPAAAARLVGEASGWRFEAFGTSIDVTPVGIDHAEVVAVAELVDDASAPLIPHDEITWAPDQDHGNSDQTENHAVLSDTSGTAEALQESAPARGFVPRDHQILVRLMGGVDVVSHDGRPGVFERSKTVELIAWLATHRSSSTRGAARTALWELDVRDATFANVVSEARRALARLVTPSGDDEWVARTLTEQLPLHEAVVTDADLIDERLTAARLQPPAQAIETLTPAAELIRDIPFAGTSYLWPDAEGIASNLVLLATGVSTELAGHALSLGDIDLVFWATGQGLKVLPGHEELIGLRMRAHARAGDLAGVRQEWESYERILVADAWSDGEPAPKLLALRHELLTSPA